MGVHDINTHAPLIEVTRSESTDTDSCPICFEELVGSNIRKINYCGHLYCAPCIEKWLQFKKMCPVCRADVEQPDAYIATGNLFNEDGWI